MVTATDDDRAQVLAMYRARRTRYAETPLVAMQALGDVYAAAQMQMLVDGGAVNPMLVRWWAAARTYAASMQGRSSWWFTDVRPLRRCTPVPA